MELVRILKNKKTGEYKCPYCLKPLKIKDNVCLYCKKCKKYMPLPYKKT